ncbi:hypothetical protein [Anaerotruncus colihominis]|uniref:hypothetical protein n=1 Tax=Anaerotruncus colihominis TaxID=169435 RepID=UPI00189B009F|nr:hypothetical protein [Anaerotruncus colihominis]
MKDSLNLFDLTGQKDIVTGARQGMDREGTRCFACCGAGVCLIDLAKSLEDTADAGNGLRDPLCHRRSFHIR